MNNLNISTILVTDSELPDGFSSPEKLCLEQDERITQKVKEHISHTEKQQKYSETVPCF